MAGKRCSAFTLIECIVVLGILAILLALLLAAVQKVRLHSLRVHASNGMRQVLIASHNYGTANQNLWPNVDGNLTRAMDGLSVIRALCPYLEAEFDHPPEFIRFRSDPSLTLPSTDDLNPPTATIGVGGPIQPRGSGQSMVTSLAFNPLVFARGKQIQSSIPDGMAMTIAITEHYGFCDQGRFDWQSVHIECLDLSSKRVPCSSSGLQGATFADGEMFQDVFPVTSQRDGHPVSVGSLPLTFQIRPPLNQCDPRIPQSSFAGGILCGFADGSVRFIGQHVSESAFWGSVTPDKGETVSLD